MNKQIGPGFLMPLLAALCGALFLWLLWGLIGVQLVASYWQWVKSDISSSVDLSTLGQTGDLFGGINALFAAFAFAGVALAAYFQYQTWKLQAEETQMARIEHIQQSFEPLFFKLMERFESVSEPARIIFKQECGDVVIHGYKGYRTSGAEIDQLGVAPRREVLAAYMSVYERSTSTLGPYFRSLFQIFKFISKSKLSRDQKILYANIARANLSEFDVTMLGFNCMTGLGKDFVVYVEAYGLLKHVKNKDAIEIFQHYYSPSAFQSSRRRLEYWRTDGTHHKPHFLFDWQQTGE